MANINSIITYNANLSPAQAQIKALTGQVAGLTTAFNALDRSALKAQRSVAATFAANVGQIGGFTAQTVKATNAVESFGKQLAANKLTMREYFREAITGYTRQSSLMRQLAEQQVRYQQSVAVPIGGGQAMMLTPQSINAASSAAQLASARFSIFNELVNGGATSMLNWGKNTQWAGRQLMVGFTLPLALFAGAMSKQFRELDKELTRFQKVYGSDLGNAVSESTQRMRDQVQQLAYDISSAYGIAAKDTAALAADIAATGAEGEKLMASVQQTTRLAVLGEVDRQEAMKATLSLQSAFRMNTNELAESINFLNAVENQTSATLEDLSVAIPKVGPVVRSLGGDVKDLATLLVAMREGGIPAAEAANALKSGLASLINPTKQASAVAKSFGVDLVGIVEANRGQLMPTIYAMQDALNGLDSFSRSRIIEQIFGKYQFARITALFDNIGRVGSQTQQVVELASRSSAELAAVANGEIRTLTESTAVKFQRTLEQLKNSLMPIGQALTETLIPILEKVGEGIKMFSTFFSALPDSVKGLAKWGVALTALAGPVIMLVGLFGNLVANGLKFGMMIVRLGARMAGIKTEKFQLLDENLMAAKLGVDNLTSAFTTQEVAMRRLVGALAAYEQSLGRLAVREPGLFVPGAVPATRGTPPIRRQKGSTAPEKVPGGYGGGDRIPALLEPGESVITKEATAKFWPVIEAMNRGNLPGFNRGTIFLGMPRGYKDLQGAKQIKQTLSGTNIEATTGRFATLPVTDIGKKVTSIGGRSSSIPGINGIYEEGGKKYVVKTHDTADSALAEVRGTQLTRDVFGLDTPVQELIKIKHPVTGDVIFAVRSPYETKFASSTGVIDEKNFFGQALAAIIRRDKDLQPDNLYGNIVTDVGQAFVANKASQPRTIGGAMPSVAEQTETNFLMSKGGARKWFAESTAAMAKSMPEDEYVKGFQTTIAEAARKARGAIDNLPYMTKEERMMYGRIIDDLDEAAKIDWRAVYQFHRGITPEVKRPPTAAALAKKEAQEAEKARQQGDMARWEYGLPYNFDPRGIIVGSGAIIGRGRSQRTHTTPEPIYTTNPDDIPQRIVNSKRGRMAKDLAAAGVPIEVLTDSWILGPFNQGLKRGVRGSVINKWLENLKDTDLGPAYRRAGISSSQLRASLSAAFKNDAEYSQKTFGEIVENTAKKISTDFRPQYDSAYIPKPSVLREYEKTLNDKGFELYEKSGRLFVKKIGSERGELSAASYPLTRQEGGIIPGYGGGDIVPAYLEPGEFVIRKEVTRENRAFLENINSGKYKKFQLGGISNNEPALLEPGEFVINSYASAQYAPILRAMNRGTIGRYQNGRDDVTMRPGYNPNDPKYSSPDKTPTGGQHQGHIFGAPVAPGIPAFGKNLQIGGQAIFWHQDFWKMVSAAENQLANVLAMSSGNRARFMESLSIVGPQFNASQQQIDRIMLAVTNGFMQHEDDVTLYQAALKNLGQRISTGAASVTGSMAGLIKQVESIKITGYSAAEAQAVERRLIAEYQRILSTPGQLAETARIAIAKQLQIVQQQMTATGIATTQMTASLASNIQASAARPFPGGDLVPGRVATQGPQLAGAEQSLTRALQLRERLQLRLIASSERLEKLDAAAARIKADTSLSEQKRKAALDNLTKQYYEELNNNEILKKASDRAEQNLIRAKERAAASYATVQPGGTGGRSGGGDTTFLGMPAIPPRSGATGPDTAMKDPMERMMRGQNLMNVAFMGSMAVGSLGALGVASEDAASKLMLLSTALMALPMLQMINPRGVATNFLGLGTLGGKMQAAGAARQAAVPVSAASKYAGASSLGRAFSGMSHMAPAATAAAQSARVGGGLLAAGRAVSFLGGPAGIAAGLGISAAIAGYMAYRDAAEEARERAIAAFNDPVKSAEYFGETIMNVSDILEKNRLSNISEDLQEVDKALREAVSQDYSPLIEQIKYLSAGGGAQALASAYSNMIISGMSAENAKAAVEAIATEAGIAGGEAFTEAVAQGFLDESLTIEQAVQNIIGQFKPSETTYGKTGETILKTLEDQRDAVQKDIDKLRLSAPTGSLAPLDFLPDDWFSKETQQMRELERRLDAINDRIEDLVTVNPDLIAGIMDSLVMAYQEDPTAAINGIKEFADTINSLENEDDRTAALDKITDYLRDGYGEQWNIVGDSITTANEKLVAAQMLVAGISLDRATNSAYQFDAALGAILVTAKMLADETERTANELRTDVTDKVLADLDKERQIVETRIKNIEDENAKLIRGYNRRKRESQEAFEIDQENRQNSIEGMQDEMDAKREVFDEEMNQLDDRKEAIEKSSEAYIKSLQKNSEAESFYSQQRKTSLSALEKLASGDVFGFLQEREQMSADAQEFSYDQMISSIEDRRDLELEAIDETRKKKQDEQEEYENMMQDRIEAEQDLMEKQQEAHDAQMQHYDKQIKKADREKQEKITRKQEELSTINDMQETASRDILEFQKKYSKDWEKYSIYAQDIERLQALNVLAVYQRGGVTLTQAAVMSKVPLGVAVKYEAQGLYSSSAPGKRGGGGPVDPWTTPYKGITEPLPDTQDLSQQVRDMTVEGDIIVNGDIVGGNSGPETRTDPSTGRTQVKDPITGEWNYVATGGLMGGGKVSGPGGPKSDSIPAMLSNGEYVIQASSVNKYGTELMDVINNGKFADGGVVGFKAGGNVGGGGYSRPTWYSADRAAQEATDTRGSKPQYSGGTPTYSGGYTSANTQATKTSGYKPKVWKQPKIKTGGGFIGDMIFEGLRQDFADFINTTLIPGSGGNLENLIGMNVSGNRFYGQRSEIDKAIGNALFGLNFAPLPFIGAAAKALSSFGKIGASLGSKSSTILNRIPELPIPAIKAAQRYGPKSLEFKEQKKLWMNQSFPRMAIRRDLESGQVYGTEYMSAETKAALLKSIPLTSRNPILFHGSPNPTARFSTPTQYQLEKTQLGPYGIYNTDNLYAASTYAKGSTGYVRPGSIPAVMMTESTGKALNLMPYGKNIPSKVIDAIDSRLSRNPSLNKPSRQDIDKLVKESNSRAKSGEDRINFINTLAEKYIPNGMTEQEAMSSGLFQSIKNEIGQAILDAGYSSIRHQGGSIMGDRAHTVNILLDVLKHQYKPFYRFPKMDADSSLMANGGLVQKFAEGGAVELQKTLSKWIPNNKLSFYSNWDQFGTWPGGKPSGVMMHHTAGVGSGVLDWMARHPEAGKPVVQAMVGRNAMAHVLAYGGTGWGAGEGSTAQLKDPKYKGLADDLNRLGGASNTLWQVEVESEGLKQDFTSGMFDTIARMTAAIREYAGWNTFSGKIINHKDWAPGRKNDTLYGSSVFEANANKIWGGADDKNTTRNTSGATSQIVPGSRPNKGLFGILSLAGTSAGIDQNNSGSGNDNSNTPTNNIQFSNIPDGYTEEDAFRTLRFVKAGGWPTRVQRLAWAIAMRESGGKNIYSSGDYGIFQLNKPSYGNQPWWTSDEKILNDPVYNSSMAFQHVSSNGTNFKPWAMRLNKDGSYSWDWSYYNPRPSWADITEKRTNAFWNSWQYKASGGFISGPGGPRSDMIPAMLSNGEYVVKASSVAKYGKGFMDKVNAGQLNFGGGGMAAKYASGGMVNPARFADGGFVGSMTSAPMPTFGMPQMTSVSPTDISSSINNVGGSSNSSSSNTSNVKVIINGAGGKSAKAIANRVISIINEANGRRNHSRSI